MPQDPDQSADQIADLQAQLDSTRSECIRPIVMEHLHRAMRTKSNTDKYHEYHALCVACLSYIDDEDLKAEVLKDLSRPDTNLSNDFIRNYKAEMKSGVPNYLILENEYSKLIPRIIQVWLKVLRALIEQELIPWTLTYPEKILEGSLIDEVINDIQMQKFKQVTPIHEAERQAVGAPPTSPQLIPVHTHFDEDDEPMTMGEEETLMEYESETEEQVEEEIEETDEEEEPIPEEAEIGNENESPQTGERIAEPEVDRFGPLDKEPEKPILPEADYEDIPEVSDEEIERGAEAIKRMLQQRRGDNARNIRYP